MKPGDQTNKRYGSKSSQNQVPQSAGFDTSSGLGSIRNSNLSSTVTQPFLSPIIACLMASFQSANQTSSSWTAHLLPLSPRGTSAYGHIDLITSYFLVPVKTL